MKVYHHTYAIDAAKLISKCRQSLHEIINANDNPDNVNPNITDLDRTLLSTEQILHYHLLTLIDQLNQGQGRNQLFESKQVPSFTNMTLMETAKEFKRLSGQHVSHRVDDSSSIPFLLTERREILLQKGKEFTGQATTLIEPQTNRTRRNLPDSFKGKSAIDSLLFRLIVILQLCQVRIDESKSIICARSKLPLMIALSSVTLASSRYILPERKKIPKSVETGVTFGFICLILRKGWRKLCMNTRLLNTSLLIEDWQQQWLLIQSVGPGEEEGAEEQCKRLLQLMPFKSKSSSIWGSQESFRYNLIKYIMDCLYASFGTAHNITKSKNKRFSILMPITAAIAASYYALVGPGTKSAKVLLNSSESSKIMQGSWGLISMQSVKTFSLQASRLLKGAAIAERIRISGVSCFVLSKEPCQALSTALRRYKRQRKREVETSQLGTIFEQYPYDGQRDPKTVINFGEYPKRNLIFHLTGGGFFAHTISGDIPFLLDWSSVTKAIVICPEYALLPEKPFPAAIDEVTRVYTSLSSGDATSLLGFRPDKIIVTGESTGGNLAAALNVKLCLDGLVNAEDIKRRKECEGCDRNTFDKHKKPVPRLPDALMMCCPALNLSLELSPSRVLTRDAVLPSTLISTISNTYLGSYPKTNPLASPFFAGDDILALFPPTLLYVSSKDPFLDDSVAFNKRLKVLGVDSDLRAAQNLPHAYWGLGTAGFPLFPEAFRVQQDCQHWMVTQLKSHTERISGKEK